MATAAVAVVAVGATLAGLVGDAGLGEGGGGTTVAEQPPTLQLAAAARATGENSFAFKVWNRWNREIRRDQPLFEGAYDPVGERGFVVTTDRRGNGFEQRIIGDHRYQIRIVDGKAVEVQKLMGRSLLGLEAALPGDVTTDPTDMLNALAEAGTVEKTGSAGGVETYAFQYDELPYTPAPPTGTPAPARTPAPTNPRTGAPARLTYTGTVEVRSGKVSSVTYRPVDSAPRSQGDGLLIETTIEFSNYGMPVDVEVPKI
ncbi:hypothetical protein [Plantactinospora mayteni]|uniref:hypothetical protein n=1 Tax=Plantactinospora mayteni TaxID=566021 RepID=UPI001944ED95|nr:hypothetical protein [Plantactinospora mayteni]